MLKPKEQEEFLKYLLYSLEEGEVVTKALVISRLREFGKFSTKEL